MATLDAAVRFEQGVAGFSRYHKCSLGMDLRQAGRSIIQQVIPPPRQRGAGAAAAIVEVAR